MLSSLWMKINGKSGAFFNWMLCKEWVFVWQKLLKFWIEIKNEIGLKKILLHFFIFFNFIQVRVKLKESEKQNKVRKAKLNKNEILVRFGPVNRISAPEIHSKKRFFWDSDRAHTSIFTPPLKTLKSKISIKNSTNKTYF